MRSFLKLQKSRYGEFWIWKLREFAELNTIAHSISSPETALRFIYAKVDDDRIFKGDQESIVVTLRQMQEGLPDGYRYFAALQALPRKGRRSKAAMAELVRDVILDRNLLT